MKTYRCIFYAQTTYSCEILAENAEDAMEQASSADWSEDEQNVYETECHEIPQVDLFNPPDIEGVEVRRLLEEPFDAKKIVESGVFTFESLGGLVKGHCK